MTSMNLGDAVYTNGLNVEEVNLNFVLKLRHKSRNYFFIFTFFMASLLIGNVESEKPTLPSNSKLCPGSPIEENVVYSFHNETKSCFRIGTKGPCEDSMIFYEDPTNHDVGQCDCDVKYRCNRPMVYWKPRNRCYRIFDQGPCPPGQWLVLRQSRDPACELDPCIRNHSEFDASHSNEFWINHSNQCILTGSEGGCPYSNEKIIFNGFSLHLGPICSAVVFTCVLPSQPSLICAPGQKWHQEGCDQATVGVYKYPSYEHRPNVHSHHFRGHHRHQKHHPSTDYHPGHQRHHFHHNCHDIAYYRRHHHRHLKNEIKTTSATQRKSYHNHVESQDGRVRSNLLQSHQDISPTHDDAFKDSGDNMKNVTPP